MLAAPARVLALATALALAMCSGSPAGVGADAPAAPLRCSSPVISIQASE
jgi:hypothetical protein